MASATRARRKWVHTYMGGNDVCDVPPTMTPVFWSVADIHIGFHHIALFAVRYNINELHPLLCMGIKNKITSSCLSISKISLCLRQKGNSSYTEMALSFQTKRWWLYAFYKAHLLIHFDPFRWRGPPSGNAFLRHTMTRWLFLVYVWLLRAIDDSNCAVGMSPAERRTVWNIHRKQKMVEPTNRRKSSALPYLHPNHSV